MKALTAGCDRQHLARAKRSNPDQVSHRERRKNASLQVKLLLNVAEPVSCEAASVQEG